MSPLTKMNTVRAELGEAHVVADDEHHSRRRSAGAARQADELVLHVFDAQLERRDQTAVERGLQSIGNSPTFCGK
jgi:hypothetical protein